MREAFGEFSQTLVDTVSDSRRGIRDVLVLIVPQVVSVLAAFAVSVLLARGLGPTGVGKYALILSVSGVAVTLSDLGIGQTAIRFASRAVSVGDVSGQMAVLRWAFRLRLLLSVAVTAVLVVLAPSVAALWKSPDLIVLVRIALLGGVFTALASIPSVYFQSLKRFSRSAAINVAQTLFSLLGIMLLAFFQLWSVRNVVVVSVIAAAVGTGLFIVSIPRLALVGRNPLPSTGREFLRKLLRNPLPGGSVTQLSGNETPTTFARYNVLSSVIVLIILRLDVWLMGVFLEQSEVGIYSIASRFSTPMAIMLTAIGGALWPRASSQLSIDDVRALLAKTLRLSGILAALGLVYAVIVPLFAPFLFGDAFAGSTLLGQVLCLRYAIAILIAPVSIIGYSLGMVRVYWKINLVQLCAVLTINVLFLPLWGSLASAVALLANELLGAFLAGIILWKRLSAAEGYLHA